MTVRPSRPTWWSAKAEVPGETETTTGEETDAVVAAVGMAAETVVGGSVREASVTAPTDRQAEGEDGDGATDPLTGPTAPPGAGTSPLRPRGHHA
jgi:hypothetical protein